LIKDFTSIYQNVEGDVTRTKDGRNNPEWTLEPEQSNKTKSFDVDLVSDMSFNPLKPEAYVNNT
jgi:hypothetical protein